MTFSIVTCSLAYKDAPAPVRYSEIVEGASNHVSAILPDQKDKEYVKMCTVQQQAHIKPYPEHINMKQPFSDTQYDPNIHQYISKDSQIHPFASKESQMMYMSKQEGQYQHQYFPKYNLQSQYPSHRTYGAEPNNFLTTLNKINPRIAQSIMNDPHIRDPQVGMYPNIDQNRPYSTQRMYHHPQSMHTSPNYPGHSSRNIPQGYNYPQQYPYKSPEGYNRLPQYPVAPPKYDTYKLNSHVEQPGRNVSPRRSYAENMSMSVNYPPITQKISPTYPQCGQLEYSRHYQHRRVPLPMTSEFYPQNYKSPYVQNPQMSPQNPESDTAIPSNSIKQFLENWVEEDINTGALPDIIMSNGTNETEKLSLIKGPVRLKEDGTPEQLYVLDTTEISRDNLPQYLHVQQVEKLPENVRGFVIKGTGVENVTANVEIISGSSPENENRTTVPPQHSCMSEQPVNLHIVEASADGNDQQSNGTSSGSFQQETPEISAEEGGWILSNELLAEETSKSMPNIATGEAEQKQNEEVQEIRPVDDDIKCEVPEEEVVREETPRSVTESVIKEVKNATENDQQIEETKDNITNLSQKTDIEVNSECLQNVQCATDNSIISTDILNTETSAENVHSNETNNEQVVVNENLLKSEDTEELTNNEEEEKNENIQKTPQESEEAAATVENLENKAAEDVEVPEKDAANSGDLQANLEDAKAEETQQPGVEERLAKDRDETVVNTEEEVLQDDPETISETAECENNEILYRSALRIENNNVLLHIEDEIVEISVTNINGKKVITVIPFTGATVVDARETITSCELQEELIESGEGETKERENAVTSEETVTSNSEVRNEVEDVFGPIVEDSQKEECENNVDDFDSSIVTHGEIIIEAEETSVAPENEVEHSIEKNVQEKENVETEDKEAAEKKEETTTPILHSPNLLTKASRKHFSDDLVVTKIKEKQESKTDIPRKLQGIKKRRVTFAEDISSVTNVIKSKTAILPKKLENLSTNVVSEKRANLKMYMPGLLRSNKKKKKKKLSENKREETCKVEDKPSAKICGEVFQENTKHEDSNIVKKPILKRDIIKLNSDSVVIEKKLKHRKQLSKTGKEKKRKTLEAKDDKKAQENEPCKKKNEEVVVNNVAVVEKELENKTVVKNSVVKRVEFDKCCATAEKRPSNVETSKEMENGSTLGSIRLKSVAPNVAMNSKNTLNGSKGHRKYEIVQKRRLSLQEYNSRKKLNSNIENKPIDSAYSTVVKVPLESQEFLTNSAQDKTKTFNNFETRLDVPKPLSNKQKTVIDADDFDIPAKDEEIVHLTAVARTRSFSAIPQDDASVKSFKEEVDFKLNSLELQIPKLKIDGENALKKKLDQMCLSQKVLEQQSRMIQENDSLMRRFLNRENLTPEEVQKVKEIIKCKRVLEEINKAKLMKQITKDNMDYKRINLTLKSHINEASYEVRRHSTDLEKREEFDANSNLKLHLKRISDNTEKPRRRKRFRNLYAEESSESEESAVVNSKLTEENTNNNYLAYQSKVINGVPKIIIKRRNHNAMQPYVKLIRSSSIDSLAKRKKTC